MTLSDDAAVSATAPQRGPHPATRAPCARNAATVTGNTATGGSGGGISLFSGTLNACDSTLDEWVGAISPNTPDDPPAPTVVTCA